MTPSASWMLWWCLQMKLLAILAREGAIGSQLNELITVSSLFASRSLKDVSNQVKEDLLLWCRNGFVYTSSRVCPKRDFLFYPPADHSLPVSHLAWAAAERGSTLSVPSSSEQVRVIKNLKLPDSTDCGRNHKGEVGADFVWLVRESEVGRTTQKGARIQRHLCIYQEVTHCNMCPVMPELLFHQMKIRKT